MWLPARFRPSGYRCQRNGLFSHWHFYQPWSRRGYSLKTIRISRCIFTVCAFLKNLYGMNFISPASGSSLKVSLVPLWSKCLVTFQYFGRSQVMEPETDSPFLSHKVTNPRRHKEIFNHPAGFIKHSYNVCKGAVFSWLWDILQWEYRKFEGFFYLRRIQGCWALSSCESYLSSQWKTLKGLSSVWEGWTLGSETFRMRDSDIKNTGHLNRTCSSGYQTGNRILLPQRCCGPCFIYNNRFGWRDEFWRLLGVTARRLTTLGRRQKP